jgi:hypothetical protein
MAITTKGVLDWILYEKAGSDHCRLIEFIKQFIKGKKNKLISKKLKCKRVYYKK